MMVYGKEKYHTSELYEDPTRVDDIIREVEGEVQKMEDEESSTVSERKMPGFVIYFQQLANRITRDHVGAYAAQSAFFLALSFIPLMIIIMQIVSYTPLTVEVVQKALMQALPAEFQPYVTAILGQVYHRSLTLFSVSAITILWSAGKVIHSLTNGLNAIYHAKKKSFLFNRLRAMFFTVLFLAFLSATLILMVFGKKLQRATEKFFPSFARVSSFIIGYRTIILIVILTIMFIIIYTTFSNKYLRIREQIKGAIFAAVGWELWSILISMILSLMPGVVAMYGSMATIMMILIWLYYGMFILLIGAEINHYSWLRKVSRGDKKKLEALRRDYSGRIPSELVDKIDRGRNRRRRRAAGLEEDDNARGVSENKQTVDCDEYIEMQYSADDREWISNEKTVDTGNNTN